MSLLAFLPLAVATNARALEKRVKPHMKVVVSPPVPVAPPKPNLPVFERGKYYCYDRLDARPVAWSMDHHPVEWDYADTAPNCAYLRHIPSEHVFYVGEQHPCYLHSTNGTGPQQLMPRAAHEGITGRCGCQNVPRAGIPESEIVANRFQNDDQNYEIRSAARRWVRWKDSRPPEVHDHFAAHFVH